MTTLQRIAQAYNRAPSFDASIVHHWLALKRDVITLYKLIRTRIDVVFVEGQPYATARDMIEQCHASGILRISTDFAAHPIFGEEINCQFRAIHDYCHIMRNAAFDLHGEISAYKAQSILISSEAKPALFTEVIGQVSVAFTSGQFPEQKIALLKKLV